MKAMTIVDKCPHHTDAANKLAVLFVCLGNICRSPLAQGVLEGKLAKYGLQQRVVVDSAGTAAWHVGSAPDPRASRIARQFSYNIDQQIARQFKLDDFEHFDFIFAMDQNNLVELQQRSERYASTHYRRLDLYLNCMGDKNFTEVPDPYYGDQRDFEHVLKLLERASDEFIQSLDPILDL